MNKQHKVPDSFEVFEMHVWNLLEQDEKELLLERFFDITTYESKYDKVHTFISPKGLPCPFVVAALQYIEEGKSSLFRQCVCDDEMMYRLSFEEDGWSALLEHNYLGLMKHTAVKQSERERLERLLKSSLDFTMEEKMLFIASAKEMNKAQIQVLLQILHDEMVAIHKQFIRSRTQDIEVLRKHIEKNKRAWEAVESHFLTIAEGKEMLQGAIDASGDPLPLELLRRVSKKVKGQDEALQPLAIAFYDQIKVMKYLQQAKTPPFRVDPLLVVGETGHGKSFSIKTFCQESGLPYVHIDASSMVRTGIRGMNVDDLLKNIIRKCEYDLKKAQGSVVILDEFDKLMLKGDYYNDTILNQLLRLIEGGEFNIEKGSNEESNEFRNISIIDTTHMFFVLSGSFQLVKDEMPIQTGFIKLADDDDTRYEEVISQSGMPKELQGRIKEVVVLKPLSEDDMYEILCSDVSPIKTYEAMLKERGISKSLDEDVLRRIAKEAIKHPFGARMLNKLVYEEYKPYLLGEVGNKTKDKSPKERFISVLKAKLMGD